MNGQQPQQPPQAPPPPQQPQQPVAGGGAPQGGARIGLYIVSFLIGLVGIILGIIYLIKPDKDSKKFGMICLILGIVGPIVWWLIVWAIIAATVVTTVPTMYY